MTGCTSGSTDRSRTVRSAPRASSRPSTTAACGRIHSTKPTRSPSLRRSRASTERPTELQRAMTSDPDRLLAETRAFNAELERLLATQPPVHTLPPAETRRARREGRSIYPPPVFLPDARTLEIEGPVQPVRLRLIAPEGTPAG